MRRRARGTAPDAAARIARQCQQASPKTLGRETLDCLSRSVSRHGGPQGIQDTQDGLETARKAPKPSLKRAPGRQHD
eukprot:9149168-Pyramimonas_sp.AAC.1